MRGQTRPLIAKADSTEVRRLAALLGAIMLWPDIDAVHEMDVAATDTEVNGYETGKESLSHRWPDYLRAARHMVAVMRAPAAPTKRKGSKPESLQARQRRGK